MKFNKVETDISLMTIKITEDHRTRQDKRGKRENLLEVPKSFCGQKRDLISFESFNSKTQFFFHPNSFSRLAQDFLGNYHATNSLLYAELNFKKLPKNSKIVLPKNDIIEFVRNLFYFFFLRCFSSSCMFASIIQKEKIDVFHSIFLFTWKIMLLTYFPSKRWNATFINCHRVRKKEEKKQSAMKNWSQHFSLLFLPIK